MSAVCFLVVLPLLIAQHVLFYLHFIFPNKMMMIKLLKCCECFICLQSRHTLRMTLLIATMLRLSYFYTFSCVNKD